MYFLGSGQNGVNDKKSVRAEVHQEFHGKEQRSFESKNYSDSKYSFLWEQRRAFPHKVAFLTSKTL